MRTAGMRIIGETSREARPVKSKRGRPKTGFNKTEYMRLYMQKRRAALKKPRE